MKTIFKYVRKKDLIALFFVVLFVVVQVGAAVTLPSYMAEITTLIKTDGVKLNQIISEGVSMLICALICFAAAALSYYFSARFTSNLCKNVRSAAFQKIMSFSLAETGHFGTSSLITRCTADITVIENFLGLAMVTVLTSILTSLGVLFKIQGTNASWTVATAIIISIMLISLIVVCLIVMPYMRKVQSVNDQLTRVNREHISGIRVIHAFNGYKHQKNRFDESNSTYTKTYIKTTNWFSVLTPLIMALYNILNILIYLLGAYILSGQEVSKRLGLYSEMVSFSSYAGQLIIAITLLVMIVVMTPRTLSCMKRVAEILVQENSIVDAKNPATAKEKGTIEFKNVSFRYPGTKTDALSNLNFKVEKGSTTAIIGATGCGKTSLLNLIPRMYDVSSGEVLVDGVNVEDYTLNDLRNRIGYVPQKSFLFEGTIGNNIGYGDNGRFQASIGHIQEAARIGQADEFIRKKEAGYDSKVAQGGSNFSGGQKQRLTISRAISRDPEIYLFDDSFSALDFKTDKTLRHKLREAAGDATMLIVAQRVGTIRNADQIIVLDEGKIVGIGTHNELIRNCDVYREIALSQMSEKEAGL